MLNGFEVWQNLRNALPLTLNDSTQRADLSGRKRFVVVLKRRLDIINVIERSFSLNFLAQVLAVLPAILSPDCCSI